MSGWQMVRFILYVACILGTTSMVFYLARLGHRVGWAVIASAFANTLNASLSLVLLVYRALMQEMHPAHELLTTVNAVLQVVLVVVFHWLFYQKVNGHG